MSQSNGDRNLIYGMLALQLGFVSSDTLLEAMHAWMLSRQTSLGMILVQRGVLSSDQHENLERLLTRESETTVERGGLAETVSHQVMRYGILREHRSGGLGQVFVAEDRELNREVALKQIKPAYASDSLSRDLFVSEAEITARLEHPHVVPVHGFGEDHAGRPWYAMRLIRGETLRAHIELHHNQDRSHSLGPGQRAVEFRELLNHFLKICDAVAYAHGRGVIHRDLKPSNVMVGPYGETVLLDWGLAKVMPTVERPDPDRSVVKIRASDRPTRELPEAGSPRYMAPEQAFGVANQINYRTDVYLLGAILFEILTGEPPHPPNDRRLDPPCPRDLKPQTPARLDQIVRKAMEPVQKNRYQQVTELSDDLRRWLAEEPIAAQRMLAAETERLLETQPNHPLLREQLAGQLANLGVVLLGMSRPEEAEESFRRAITEYDRLIEARPDEARHRAQSADAKVHLARTLRVLGRADAERAEREAIQAYNWLMLSDPDAYQVNLAHLSLTLAPGTLTRPDGDRVSPETSVDSDSGPGTFSSTGVYLGPTSSPDGGEDRFETHTKFTILREIGRGGGSLVLLARDNELNREVVIKQLQMDSPETIRRFRKEAQVTAQLEHPFIIPVYGLGRRSDDERPFLVLRHCEGKTLREWIRSGDVADQIRINFLLQALIKVCDALEFAHGQGVIHRDPKPANVIVSEAGEVTLLDWGLAKVTQEDQASSEETVRVTEWADPGLTQSGAVMGTPVYMAPEMIRGAKDVDHRVDIYIVGSTLFEILTGRVPFAVEGQVWDLLRRKQSVPAPGPRELLPSVSLRLDAICRRAMHIDPEQRYQRIGDLRNDIADWLKAEQGSGRWGYRLVRSLRRLFRKG